jgi:hypothetical protein
MWIAIFLTVIVFICFFDKKFDSDKPTFWKFARIPLIVFAIFGLMSSLLPDAFAADELVDPEGSSETAPASNSENTAPAQKDAGAAEKLSTPLTGGGRGGAPPSLISEILLYLVVLLALLALGGLMLLVYLIWTRVKDLHGVAGDSHEKTELHLVTPVRTELNRLRDEWRSLRKGDKAEVATLLKDHKAVVATLRKDHETELTTLRNSLTNIAKQLNESFGTVQAHLKGTRGTVEQQQEEMVNIGKLATERSKEIERYQEGIRLSSVKPAMDRVIKALDHVRKSLGATVEDEEKTAVMSRAAVEVLETDLKEALLAADVEEYGTEAIGRPYKGHEKDHAAIPNEPEDPKYGPGIITACSLSGYRHRIRISPDHYVYLRRAEVKVNHSTEHEQSVSGEEST